MADCQKTDEAGYWKTGEAECWITANQNVGNPTRQSVKI